MSRSPIAFLSGLVVLAVAVALADTLLNAYYVQILALLGIYIMMTVSLNFAAGYGGMFSLGHPAFMAIGGLPTARSG